jgi:O-antigen/teichoic acid export membrane protein
VIQIDSNEPSKSTLIKGTLAGFMSNFGSAAITFLSAPLLIHFLGVDGFGQWSACLLCTFSLGILGLMDLGISDFVQRIVAASANHLDQLEVQQKIRMARTSIFQLILPLALISSIALTSTSIGPNLVRSTFEAKVTAALFFLIEPILESQNQISKSILDGSFRHSLSRTIDLSSRILQSIGLVLLAGTGQKIHLLLVAVLVTSLVRFAIYRSIISPAKFSYAELRIGNLGIPALLTASRGFAALRLLSTLYYQIDKLAIIVLLGTSVLADYEAVYRVQSIALLVLASCSTVVFATSANSNSSGNLERLYKIFDIGTRMTIALILSICLTTIAFSPRLLRFIFGSDFERLWPCVLVALISPILSSVNYIGIQIQVATGREGKLVRLQTIAMFVNTGFTLILTAKFGLIGVTLGTLLGTLATWIPFQLSNRELFQSGLIPSLKNTTIFRKSAIALPLILTLSTVIKSVPFFSGTVLTSFVGYFIALLGSVLLSVFTFLSHQERVSIKMMLHGARQF